MDTLSLDASVAITGMSRSTLWRRVTDGTIGRGDKDGRSRAMLALDDVLGLVDVVLSAEDIAMLLRADAGDADAQADMGALFYVAGAHKAALYWLNEAAAQNNAEAMQWLGTAYASGGALYRKMPILQSCGWPRRQPLGIPSRNSRWSGCAKAVGKRGFYLHLRRAGTGRRRLCFGPGKTPALQPAGFPPAVAPLQASQALSDSVTFAVEMP